jgi:threonine/homoserine/homoserine lactone efflux protein
VDALILGLSIGLAAGISPGPLLVLVIASTLRSGWRAGVLTAAAPLLSDAIVVGVSLLVLGRIPYRALALVGVVGGGFVIWIGVQTVRDARAATLDLADPHPAGGSGAASMMAVLRRAGAVNLFSPHPWLTWATAMGPLVIEAWRRSHPGGVALVGGFYLTLIGAKVAVAALVATGRRRLGATGYRRALTIAGAALVVAGVALTIEFAPAALR